MLRKHANEGEESVEQITTRTLDGEYPLAEEVKLPTNVTVEECFLAIYLICRWLYTNLVYFVQEISLLYDSYGDTCIFDCSISDECTSQTCPEMTAGPHYTYLWTDSKGSSPIEVQLVLIFSFR